MLLLLLLIIITINIIIIIINYNYNSYNKHKGYNDCKDDNNNTGIHYFIHLRIIYQI